MADNNSKQFQKCSFSLCFFHRFKIHNFRKNTWKFVCTKHVFPLSYNASHTIHLIPLLCLELITTFLCFLFRLFTIQLSVIEADLLYFYHKHTINVRSSSCTSILSYFCQIWNKSGIEFHEIFPVGAELFDPHGRTGRQINGSSSRFS